MQLFSYPTPSKHIQNLEAQQDPTFPSGAPLHIASQSTSSGSDVVFSVEAVVGFVSSVVSVVSEFVVLLVVVVDFVVVVVVVMVVVMDIVGVIVESVVCV